MPSPKVLLTLDFLACAVAVIALSNHAVWHVLDWPDSWRIPLIICLAAFALLLIIGVVTTGPSPSMVNLAVGLNALWTIAFIALAFSALTTLGAVLAVVFAIMDAGMGALQRLSNQQPAH